MSKLKAEQAQVEYTSKEMCLTKTGNMADQVWRQNVNRAFKEFFGLYSMETIEYDQREFGTIRALTTAMDTSTDRVDYVKWSTTIPTEKPRLFIMGLAKDFNAFFSQHSRFQHLLTTNKIAKVDQNNNNYRPATPAAVYAATEPSEVDETTLVAKYLEIPDSIMSEHSELVKLSFEVFKETFELCEFRLLVQETTRVIMFSRKNDVDRVYAALSRAFKSIKCKRVEGLSLNVTECKKLSMIVQEVLEDLKSAFTIKIRSSDIEQDSGIFVSYLYDIAEIGSVKDSTYQEVCKTIKDSICSFDLNLTSYSAMIKTAKWTEFERKHLSDEAWGKKFVYALTWNANGQHHLHMTGLKDYLLPLKTKVLDFFQLNSSLTKVIGVKEHEVSMFIPSRPLWLIT